jgi:hypothetical protein
MGNKIAIPETVLNTEEHDASSAMFQTDNTHLSTFLLLL